MDYTELRAYLEFRIRSARNCEQEALTMPDRYDVHEVIGTMRGRQAALRDVLFALDRLENNQSLYALMYQTPTGANHEPIGD